MPNVDSAELQRWFAWLVELDHAAAEDELAKLSLSDPPFAASLRELLAADVELAGTPTEPLLPLLRGLRDDAWEGRTIGEWRIGKRLGSGGMGTVYRAERASTSGDAAALKVLRADRNDSALRRRFALECKVLQSLQHAGIARLVGSGETAEGVQYVAMELVEGAHLIDYADRERLDLHRRVELLLKICAAVAHAHARQVVHRDIKDSNILVTAQGQPKLLDFGIAKPLQAQFGTDYLERTATGQRFFSASSAAPEQLSGAATGPACDVYALGALLYELLSGETPFALQGASAAQIERTITQQVPPPPSRRVAELPAAVANARARQRGCTDRAALVERLRGDFDSIVAKALRKDPAQRHVSVDRFAHELRAACRGGGAPEPLLRRLRQRFGFAQRVGAAVIAAIVIAAIALRPRGEEVPPAASAAPVAGAAAVAQPAEEAATDPVAKLELTLVRAQRELQRRAPDSALAQLRDAEALLTDAGEPRELALQLAALKANAATVSGDFPLAREALDRADALAATSAERASLVVQRARLLSARGRDDEASALLRTLAADTLPRLAEGDPNAAQIRSQIEALGVAADGPVRGASGSRAEAADLAARIEALSQSIERARARAGAGVDAAVLSPGVIAPPAESLPSIPDASAAAGSESQLLAEEITRACALNARGEYAEAAQLLDRALERQRSDPSLRHGDDYRIGVLAAAIAHHAAAPTADSAQRLSHELARDVWLSADASRARWREQAAIAHRLGVQRAE